MPNFTVAQTIADQTQQAVNASRDALSSVSSTTLSLDTSSVSGALGGVADKIKSASNLKEYYP